MAFICIVTTYKSNNYGTRLQSFALSRYLQQQGHEVCFLDHFHVWNLFVKHPILLYARVRNRLLQKEKKSFYTPSPYSISLKREQRLEQFTRDNYRILNVTDAKSWEQLLRKNPIFIAGSDIIWQPALGYPSRYFLDFAAISGLPCLSYASSIGARELPQKYYPAYRRYLSRYINVAVREKAAANMLEQIVERPITTVVDPTLLLSSDEWRSFAGNSNLSVEVSEGGYILCYFVMDDDEYWKYVDALKQLTSLQVVIIPMHEKDERASDTVVTDGTPYEFVKLIDGARIVLTDSFHACCFSIIFEKDFYLVRRARTDENDKYDNLLGRYNLLSRVISHPANFGALEKIDYEAIRSQVQDDVRESCTYIARTLESAELSPALDAFSSENHSS